MRKIITWGMWIRKYLLKKGSDYINNIYREYNKFIASNGYKPIKYSTFHFYIRVLESLNLVKTDRLGKPPQPWLKPRRYVRINPDKVKSILWYNPLEAYWKKMGYGEKVGSRYYQKREKKKKPTLSQA